MLPRTNLVRLHRRQSPQWLGRSASAWASAADTTTTSHTSNSQRPLSTSASTYTYTSTSTRASAQFRSSSCLLARGNPRWTLWESSQQQRHFHASSVWQEDEKPAEDPAKKEEEPPATESATPPPDTPREYSTPEITADAAKHKAGLTDNSIYEEPRPFYQNPLAHENDHLDDSNVGKIPPLDNPDGSYSAPAYIHELAAEMCQLNMLEMNELTNKLQEHYGFADGMMEPDGGGDGPGGDGDDDDDDDEAAVEKTAFDIKLVSFDAKAKIKIIKEVRAMAGLGLKEAKEMVEGAPTIIQKELKKEDAEGVKAKLEELGAVVEIV